VGGRDVTGAEVDKVPLTARVVVAAGKVEEVDEVAARSVDASAVGVTVTLKSCVATESVCVGITPGVPDDAIAVCVPNISTAPIPGVSFIGVSNKLPVVGVLAGAVE
jgi:hypothetical protein